MNEIDINIVVNIKVNSGFDIDSVAYWLYDTLSEREEIDDVEVEQV